jgi:hypothetical protein
MSVSNFAINMRNYFSSKCGIQSQENLCTFSSNCNVHISLQSNVLSLPNLTFKLSRKHIWFLCFCESQISLRKAWLLFLKCDMKIIFCDLQVVPQTNIITLFANYGFQKASQSKKVTFSLTFNPS